MSVGQMSKIFQMAIAVVTIPTDVGMVWPKDIISPTTG